MSEENAVTSEDSPLSPEPSPQEESIDENGASTHKLCLKVPPDDSQISNNTPQFSQKTQGIRPPRDGGIGVLQSAAKKAAASNSRSDVHEYMRIRRSFV